MMNRVFYFLLFLFCGCGTLSRLCLEESQEQVAHSDRGTERWCEIVDLRGERISHGPFESRYPGGQIRALGRYQNGKREGVWKGWHANGNREYEIDYIGGIKEGRVYFWFENGSPNFESQWKSGKLDGPSRHWSLKGHLLLMIEFKAGRFHGQMVEFNERGEKIFEGLYEHGVHIRTLFEKKE